MTTATIAINRESPTDKVIDFIRNTELPEGTKAEVVGVWVWVYFPEKPPAEIRKQMNESGFRWMPHRSGQPWAHACGEFRRKGKGNPKDRYDTVDVRL